MTSPSLRPLGPASDGGGRVLLIAAALSYAAISALSVVLTVQTISSYGLSPSALTTLLLPPVLLTVLALGAVVLRRPALAWGVLLVTTVLSLPRDAAMIWAAATHEPRPPAAVTLVYYGVIAAIAVLVLLPRVRRHVASRDAEPARLAMLGIVAVLAVRQIGVLNRWVPALTLLLLLVVAAMIAARRDPVVPAALAWLLDIIVSTGVGSLGDWLSTYGGVLTMLLPWVALFALDAWGTRVIVPERGVGAPADPAVAPGAPDAPGSPVDRISPAAPAAPAVDVRVGAQGEPLWTGGRRTLRARRRMAWAVVVVTALTLLALPLLRVVFGGILMVLFYGIFGQL